MAKGNGMRMVVGIIAWLVGLIVTLTIGGALIGGTLALPTFLGGATEAGILAAQITGWIVVVGALLGALLAIIEAAMK